MTTLLAINEEPGAEVIEFPDSITSHRDSDIHPARYSQSILDKITEIYEDYGMPDLVLDPFAGTGRVHDIPGINAVGVELEPEWAELHPRTVQGNALALPFADGTFTGMTVSPCYGNRYSDAHNAKDGSYRRSYTHDMRRLTGDPDRKLHPDNAGTLAWGQKYRSFHAAAWTEALRVLDDDALIVVNTSNFIKAGVEQLVTEFHFSWFMDHGCQVVDFYRIKTPRNRRGANHQARVEHEDVFVFRKETTP